MIKRGIGALFLAFGLWTVFSGKFPASGTGRVLAWLSVAFLILGGSWWLAGKGEPYPVSMKARLALIFGLLLLVLCPIGALYITPTFGAKIGIVADGVVFALLGLPALVLGHAARRTVAQSAFLRGSGRAAVALLIGYVCLCAIGFDAVSVLYPHLAQSSIVREPEATVTASTDVVSPASQQSTAASNSPDVLGVVWDEKESGQWRGRWTRRGLSNVFDAVIRDGDHGGTKTFVAVVSHKGNSVHVITRDSSDGKNSVYDGTLSADGRTIQGAYVCNGRNYSFSANIVLFNHSYAKDGTYFLLGYKSVKTSNGVTGFPPGTQVERVADQGDSLSVRVESYQFDVSKAEITNDINIARYLAASDDNEQSALYAQASKDQNAAARAKLAQLQREEENRQKKVAAAQQPPARYVSPLERGAYGQTSSVSGSKGWMQGVTITKAQSEQLMNYFLDHAKPDTSIDLAPLPLMHSAMDVRRARDRVQSETARTDISRSDYNQLVERLHQLDAIPVGGPDYLESPYRGYEKTH